MSAWAFYSSCVPDGRGVTVGVHEKESIEAGDASTLIQHAGKEHRVGAGLVSALETSVTFSVGSPEDTPVYQRLSNTANHKEVTAVLAALEGAEAAFVTSSGMAALHTALLGELRPGDHVVCQDSCYGSTQGLLRKVFEPLGVGVSFAPIEMMHTACTERTRVFLVESISNPLCVPQDVASVIQYARSRGAVSIVDNTFASPINMKPVALGADYVVESATKYLNGHSDQVAGVIAGSADKIRKAAGLAMYTGCFLSTEGCHRLLRGIRTLAVRMRAHNEGGLAFAAGARQMQELGVEAVFHGPPSGGPVPAGFKGFGGMVCLRFHPEVSVEKLMRHVKLITDVPSLGGTETTACMPIHTTHKWTAPEECARQGVTRHLLRVSIGLEDPRDLLADLSQGLILARRS